MHFLIDGGDAVLVGRSVPVSEFPSATGWA
jgi:hypothetical protein